jgi:large subunit ribosomal protein L3
MTRLIYREDNSKSHVANTQRIAPVTVVETPPVILYGIRAYKMTPYGLQILSDVITNSPSRFFKRRRRYPEVENLEEQIDAMREKIDDAYEIRAVVHTQPDLTGIGNKTPETFEIKIGGPSNSDIFEWAVERLTQELQVEDFTKPGEFLDVIGITKGKGFNGVIKRHGVTRLSHKTKDGPRKVGTIGPWTPARLRWNIPRYGQLGYFRRTEYNKRVMKLGVDGSEVTPSGGFVKYGNVNNRYILLKGSVPGPKKRIVVLRDGMRSEGKNVTEPQLSFISQHSQQ